MHSDAFHFTLSFTIRLQCFIDNTSACSKVYLYLGPFLKRDRKLVRDTGKVTCDSMAYRWIQKWRVRTRERIQKWNRTPHSDLVVVDCNIQYTLTMDTNIHNTLTTDTNI